jgi:HEAT repeat protein
LALIIERRLSQQWCKKWSTKAARYAGIGWDAIRTIMKDRSDGSPVKAAAASNLVSEPDSRTAAALVNATHNRNWVVRVAALEAIAERGDSTDSNTIEPLLQDSKLEVKYTAAATIVRLGSRAEPAGTPRKD